VGIYLKNTPTSGESVGNRLSFTACALYQIFGEDGVILADLNMHSCAWRSSSKAFQIDVYYATNIHAPQAGMDWGVLSAQEVTTPAYRKRGGGTLVVATPVMVLRGSATLDFPSITANNAAALTITVTGAAVGDDVTVHHESVGTSNGLIATAWVSAANTVTVRLQNCTQTTIDQPSSTVRVNVFKFA
jgi:hypothetical protein